MTEDLRKKARAIQASINKSIKNKEDQVIILDGDSLVPLDAIPTGCPYLDYEVLGIGGIPRGRITEIFGAESVGKTTLCLQLIREAQALGEVAAFIDVEHSLNLEYAKTLGVDLQSMLFDQPMSGEDALNKIKVFAEKGVGLIVLDSVAGLVPTKEVEADIGATNVATIARLMSQALRQLAGIISKHRTALVFTNQERDNISLYGAPSITPGGKALKYNASVRLQMRYVSGGRTKKEGKVVSTRIAISAVKNKVSIPFKSTESDLVLGHGFAIDEDYISLAIDLGLIVQRGSIYDINFGEFSCSSIRGKDNAVKIIQEHEGGFELLKTIINDHYKQHYTKEHEYTVSVDTDEDS